MNKAIIALFFILSACATPITYQSVDKISRYEIASIPFVKEADTTYIRELRFLDIKTSRQLEKTMRKEFGKWDETFEGKYQENITRHVWRKVTLFENEPSYTIITDGTETISAYFTAVMVFDAEDNDCFTPSHPDKQRLIRYFEALKRSYKR